MFFWPHISSSILYNFFANQVLASKLHADTLTARLSKAYLQIDSSVSFWDSLKKERKHMAEYVN